jgi:hypothetical protein
MDKDEYKEEVLKKLRDIEVEIGIIGISSMIADALLLFIMIIVLFK